MIILVKRERRNGVEFLNFCHKHFTSPSLLISGQSISGSGWELIANDLVQVVISRLDELHLHNVLGSLHGPARKGTMILQLFCFIPSFPHNEALCTRVRIHNVYGGSS